MKIMISLLCIIVGISLVSCTTTNKQYRIEFNSNGGTLIEGISVEENTILSIPVEPTKDGFTFFGWYLDEDLSVTYLPQKPITEDITLFARWVTSNEIISVMRLGEPGLTPEIFSPGFISTEENTEFAGTFSPDYQSYFYTRREEGGTNRLFYTTFENGVWSNPNLSPVSEEVSESEPFITNDGTTLYFHSRRDNPASFSIYQSSFINGVWQNPVLADKGLNDIFVMYITVADSGNIYFTGLSSSEAVGIYVIKYADSTYQPAEYTGISGAHPYVAPDESYILFDKGVGSSDYIYISRNNDNEWTTPVILGADVNEFGAIQICPSVTPDGKYFFFSRFIDGKSDIYWVDGSFLNQYLQ